MAYMGIRILIYTIVLTGSTVEKQYLFDKDELIVIEDYFYSNDISMGKKFSYYKKAENFVSVLFNEELTKEPLSLYRTDSWSRVDFEYKIVENTFVRSDSEIIRTIEPTVEITKFRKLDFVNPYFELITEIVEFDSMYYLQLESITTFNCSCIFSTKLKVNRECSEKEVSKFNEIRSKFM